MHLCMEDWSGHIGNFYLFSPGFQRSKLLQELLALGSIPENTGHCSFNDPIVA